MNNMDIAGLLGAGIFLVLGIAVVSLLIATIVFRAATKWVISEDISFWKSMGIVVVGGLASGIASVPVSLLLGLTGASETVIQIVSFVMGFCLDSFIYSLMLKTNFWRASLIQIIFILISIVLIVGFAIIMGFIFAGIGGAF